jgi:OOP family OmpA-OmpF porin
MLNKLALAFVIASVSVGAIAQSTTDIPANKGRSAYVEDSHGNIMRTPFGHCWRSALWTPADAVAGCDGDLTPPIVKPTAPAIVANPAPSITAVAAPKRCDFSTQLDGTALFGPKSAKLTATGKKRLQDAVLARIAGCDKVEKVVVAAGAPMMRGPDRKLAQSRARSAAAFLKSGGVKAPIGVDDKPAAACGRGMPSEQRMDCAVTSRQLEITVRGSGR